MKYAYLLIFILVWIIGHAQKDSIISFDKAYKRTYTITKVSDRYPLMDGRLDEEFWIEHGEWSEFFVQVAPYERIITPSHTKSKLLYDNKYIYVGIYCKDIVPEKMNQFIGNRDDNSIGDLVSVAFDTYHDFRAAPEFNLNLGGNKTDLIVTDKLAVNLSWNAVWEGRTHINRADSSWTAEMRIPFNQLRYNQLSEKDIWGLHVRRVIRRNSEVQNWSMIPLKNNGHVFSFGEMHGMADLPKPRGIEFTPYLMGKYKNEPKIKGSPYQKGHLWGGNGGLDVKVALSDYTLDLTVNPDFGQIELDPSVMNLTAYETFYEEKRPFFLEGKHILDFSMGKDMMFYTRRIGAAPSYHPQSIDNENSFAETVENVPIIGALKLTGTNRQGVTLGVVQSVTACSSVKVRQNGMEDSETVEPLTNYTVARVQKNWKGNTLLGGMLTSVNRALNEPYLEHYLVRNAYTAGIDFTQYFSNRLYYIDVKGMFSSLNGSTEAITRLQKNAVHYYQRASGKDYLEVVENRTSLNGTGGYLKIGRKGNAKWTFSQTFSWLSPGFDLNDIGYLKQADKLSNETIVEFRQTDTWKMFRNNTLTFIQSNQWNFGGKPVRNDYVIAWKSMFLNRNEFYIDHTYCWNWLESRRLRGGPDIRYDNWSEVYVNYNTDKAKRVMFLMQYLGNYDLNGNDSYSTFTSGLTLRLGNHIHLTSKFNYTQYRDDLQYVSTVTPDVQSEPVYVIGCMDQRTYGLTMKLQINITPDISFQCYGAPFTSTGRYKDFKKAVNPESYTRADRFYTFLPNEISFADDNYAVQTETENLNITNPDFNFNEFRSNFVARWEYQPGSTLYLVWEHSMSNRAGYHLPGWDRNLDRMFGLPSTNIFMVKLNYWFNI